MGDDVNTRLQLGMNTATVKGMPTIGRDLIGIGPADRPLIGAGADAGDCASILLDQIRCNIAEQPRVPFKRTYYRGPIADAVLATALGGSIDMLSSTSPGAKEVSGNYMNNGALPFSILITGIFCHMVAHPFNMTIEGAAVTAPTAALGAKKGIVVPDAWNLNDMGTTYGAPTATTNTLNLDAISTSAAFMVKAYLEVGGWQQRGFYYMGRGWNWYWLNGDNIIMNYPLREVAKVVPAPQDYSGGQARLPFAQYVRDCNDYYAAVDGTGATNTSMAFLPRNATRTGSLDSLTAAKGLSTFEPYSYFDEAVTYGGPGLAEMGCNDDFYRLPKCIVWPANTPLGMTLQQVSGQAATRAQREFSITNNAGAAATPPAIILPHSQYSAGTTTASGTTAGSGANSSYAQLSQDSPPVTETLFTNLGTQTALFKIGDYWFVFGLVGWGLTDGVYNQLVDPNNGPRICQIIASATGGRVCLSVPNAG